MINRAKLKFDAKESLKGQWGTGVILTLLFLILTSVLASIPVLNIMVSSVLQYGIIIAFLKLTRSGTYDVADVFEGFNNFLSAALLGLVVTIFTALWALLLIVPGIIAAISYSMALYILADNPSMDFMEAIRQSKIMTNGYKMDIFVLYLSFLGWGILCLFTFGIGFLWLMPYQQATFAKLYEQLKNEVQSVE